MREVHVYFIGVNIVVLGRVDTGEVLVLDEIWAMCRGQRGEGNGTLEILTGRWIVEVYGVGLEDVVAVGCRGVDLFVDFTGVERSVVVISDGEGDGVRSWWLYVASPPHRVMGEGHLCIEVEVEAAVPGFATSPPPAVREALRCRCCWCDRLCSTLCRKSCW